MTTDALLTPEKPSDGEDLDSERRRQSRFEHFSQTVSAFVLAVSAFATAWSAYQASLWSGTQAQEMAFSNHTAREATEAQLTGNQAVQFDASLFASYLDALTSNRPQFAAFLHERLRPGLKESVDAWLAAGPNESAPGPMKMPAYHVDEWVKADGLRKDSSEHMTASLRANRISDNYVFGTLLFAVASLLGGAGPKLGSRFMRRAFLALVALVCAGSLVWVLRLPVGHRDPVDRHEPMGSAAR
ncbi:MAG TPA: hypothetical protein VH044_19160 [Polyangiaceae bacterium]|jgi:hypothetical protein|nr:hypothetical protein [Polyangiaceae bacterium]